MITFFDIPSTMRGKCWSFNTWKTRLSLNYKKLPYKTVWVEYPDIAAVLQKHDIGPTGTSRNGSPYYSLPAIIDTDDQTGALKAALAESFKIAQYLDQAYPDTPKLLPLQVRSSSESSESDAVEAQRQFSENFLPSMMAIGPIIVKAIMPQLNEASWAHFSRARAMDLYDMYHTETLEEITIPIEQRAALWAATKGSFDALDKQLGPGPGYLKDGPISFADFVVGAFLIWINVVFGEESSEWTDVKSWNGGRWEKVLQSLGPYMSV